MKIREVKEKKFMSLLLLYKEQVDIDFVHLEIA